MTCIMMVVELKESEMPDKTVTIYGIKAKPLIFHTQSNTYTLFWSDEERFTQAVLDAARRRVINEFGDDLKGQKGGADTLAVDEAERVMSGIKEERFLTDKMMSVELNTHAELQISAEDLSDWDARKA